MDFEQSQIDMNNLQQPDEYDAGYYASMDDAPAHIRADYDKYCEEQKNG